jgi:hypothetical protein
MADVKKVYASLFGNAKEVSKLRARSWKEPHLLLYQNMEGQPLHTGVEMHYDGCSLTWNCLLSSNDEFTGGGTYIRALRKTVMLKQGQVLVHPGDLYHMGCDITSGVRSLIVCFMDGFDPKVKDPSSSKTDRVEYQSNLLFC